MKEIIVRLFSFLVMVILFSTLSFANDVIINVNGKDVILHDNYTWEYSDITKINSSDIKTLTITSNLTTVLRSKNGKYQLNINPNIWDQTRGNNDSAEFQFVNKEQTGFSVVLYDGLPIPLENMKKILIVNANKIDPNSYILNVEKCIVNNTEGELVTYSATTSGLDFTFYAFIASKDSGTIQYTFYTLSSFFEKMKPIFIDAISGLIF